MSGATILNKYVIVSALSIAFNPLFWNTVARAGDYFGILMSERVTSFPFNVLEHPMYVGSTLSFFGVALYYNSLVGVLLSCFVIVCYMVASKFEGEFTSMIYRQAAEKESKRK
ncbi:Phosphatidyl-N-methylethanolamine N-methyltransferase [Zancudomyces culisetae]|uniref:phosphatidyl-N-methylethanolamine N-methyltransferase n=1 Tax=Zancudomyces culisetae TaxID=1213189 RepID=A0A1R1PPW0_ZANCU|nr:Phosphatidyl-N-methylethanolamine N-methyltransferase [Zancudomyces culisetae]OMH82997.1 Phosphatidyl-N-methylethanolamine N-methyltransferase [Zancudomyces culisetae]|eukprot:OMH80397.1 Phosphatidyl-N-methylethanolamine N-methyltransferase [Zancudomyces culisetae]